uniref:Structural protein p72 n=45 Tax=African swine fever virus TaxID=10497 RepID=A0A6G7NU05_ASF|nr:structural protein p72 [African swine fever virus]
MASGGAFCLIANDGKADKIILAQDLLNSRISNIKNVNKSYGKPDPEPTLSQIEETHLVHFNAHFKPYVPVGFEYNKVRPHTGTPTLGNKLTFGIPQYGDFFHDMVGHHILGACHSSWQDAPIQGTSQMGAHGQLQTFPRNGYDWDNQTPLEGAVYTLVDPFGRPIVPGTKNAYRNLVYYCEYPGERLYENVRFDVNGNSLDEYSSDVTTLVRKFCIPGDKMTGYKHLVGQEVSVEGTSGPLLCNIHDLHKPHQSKPILTDENDTQRTCSHTNPKFLSQHFPENSHNIQTAGKQDITPITDATYLDIRRNVHYSCNGPQTPKYYQPPLALWIKLRFWFNENVNLAIPSVSIPFGERFITIKLASQKDLVNEFPGLFVRQSRFIAGRPSRRNIRFKPWFIPGVINEISLTNNELYINNLFVTPEIHNLFVKRVRFSLIRVHKTQVTHTNNNHHDEKLMSALKWPIEYMFIGLKPTWNISDQNPHQHRDWYKFGHVVNAIMQPTHHAEISFQDRDTALPDACSSISDISPVTYPITLPIIKNISVTAHGINLIDKFPSKFCSSYIPFHYGGSAIKTPDDPGAMMITFALKPREEYQPSGHINVSRAREFYISWDTDYVGSITTADLVVSASAINFLLLQNGSAVLRYST